MVSFTRSLIVKPALSAARGNPAAAGCHAPGGALPVAAVRQRTRQPVRAPGRALPAGGSGLAAGAAQAATICRAPAVSRRRRGAPGAP